MNRRLDAAGQFDLVAADAVVIVAFVAELRLAMQFALRWTGAALPEV